VTGAPFQIIRFTYPRPAMPASLARTHRTQARRPNATYLLVVFVLFALASAAVLPEWLSTPAPADPAASVTGRQSIAAPEGAPADDITGLLTAATIWLDAFAAEDAGQMASAADDVTRITGSLSFSLHTIRETPRTRAAGSAGHLRAALAYLTAGITNSDPVAVTRGIDLLRLVQPTQPARS